VPGDTVTSVTLTSAGAPAAATVLGSPYSIMPSAALGTGLTNYTITYKPGTLTVTPATPILSLACPKVPYDGKPHGCTGSGTGVGGAAVSGTWVYSPVSGTNAGSYPTTGTFTSTDPNYVSGGTANGTLIIDKVTLTITANSGTMTFGGFPTVDLSMEIRRPSLHQHRRAPPQQPAAA
jgi:hypothetical protein